MLWPIEAGKGYISQYWGENPNKYGYGADGHKGLDFGGCAGMRVVAANSGIVTRIDYGSVGYGKLIKINDIVYETRYAHLLRYLVADGQKVKAGDPIGIVGTTGNSTGDHLHFEVLIDEVRTNPLRYLIGGGMSKLSWHFQKLDSEIIRIANSCPAKYIKQMFFGGDAIDYFPTKLTIARMWIGGDNVEAGYVGQGAAGADAYFNLLKPRYAELRGKVLAFEGPNEPAVDTAQQRANLVAFTRRWTQLMHANGYKVVVGCFANGTPQVRASDPTSMAWAELAGIFDGADYWARHSYGWPNLLTDKTWFALRHRLDVAELRALGVTVPRLIITETGIDSTGHDSGTRRGWQAVTSEEDYMAQLVALDAELSADSYVLAATVFTSCPESTWRTFGVTESLSRRMAAHIIQYTAPVETPEPEPAPEPHLPLPDDETATDAATLATKVRWHTENLCRQLEGMGIDRDSYAMQILYGLIRLDGGLMYRMENALK